MINSVKRSEIIGRIFPERGVAIFSLCEKREIYVWKDNGVCREKRSCFVKNCPKKNI